MANYSILWLDDDFLPLIENPEGNQIEINEKRNAFMNDVRKAKKKNLMVDGVPDLANFKEKLENYGKYQAVILDLKGLDQENVANDYVVQDALEAIHGLPLLVYIYSANSNAEKFDLTLKKIKDKGNCFDKALGPKDLFEKILSDLNEFLDLYKPYPELLELFNKGYLPSADRWRMDSLLEDYALGNASTTEKAYIRDLFQGMLESLVYDGKKEGKKLIDNRAIKPKLGRFGDMFKYITYGGSFNGVRNDFSSPIVPESICPAPIKNAIQYVGNMANLLDHGKDGDEEVFDKPYYSTMMLGIYPTMIEILKWYYYYMES